MIRSASDQIPPQSLPSPPTSPVTCMKASTFAECTPLAAANARTRVRMAVRRSCVLACGVGGVVVVKEWGDGKRGGVPARLGCGGRAVKRGGWGLEGEALGVPLRRLG